MFSIAFLLGVFVIIFLGLKDPFYFCLFGGIIFLAVILLSLISYYMEKQYYKKMQPELGLLIQKDKQERERIKKEYEIAISNITEHDPLDQIQKKSYLQQKYESDLETWHFRYKMLLDDIKRVKDVKDFRL